MKNRKVLYFFTVALAFVVVLLMSSCDKNEEVYCYELYAPVCAEDGKTYSNDCYARVAGNKSWRAGECSNSACTINPDTSGAVLCTQEYNPVCGCNGVTYGNECMAGLAGVSAYVSGACYSGN